MTVELGRQGGRDHEMHKDGVLGMSRVIIAIDGVVIKEVALTPIRTTLGRRPYNHVVVDHLTVSGEHAAFETMDGEVFLEDLHSTNGTYVNGRRIQRQALVDGDVIDIGKYKLQFIQASSARSSPPQASDPSWAAHEVSDPTSAHELPGRIKVLSGAASGREVCLTKPVTTLGKPGVAVAAITRQPHAFTVAHVEGSAGPRLNGRVIGRAPMTLQHGDLIELAGTQMQFIQA